MQKDYRLAAQIADLAVQPQTTDGDGCARKPAIAAADEVSIVAKVIPKYADRSRLRVRAHWFTVALWIAAGHPAGEYRPVDSVEGKTRTVPVSTATAAPIASNRIPTADRCLPPRRRLAQSQN